MVKSHESGVSDLADRQQIAVRVAARNTASSSNDSCRMAIRESSVQRSYTIQASPMVRTVTVQVVEAVFNREGTVRAHLCDRMAVPR